MKVGDDFVAVMRGADGVPPATRALALTVADAVESVLGGEMPEWELELPLGHRRRALGPAAGGRHRRWRGHVQRRRRD